MSLTKDTTLVTHNGISFDLPFLLLNCTSVTKSVLRDHLSKMELVDTLILSRMILQGNHGHSVEDWAARLRKVNPSIPVKYEIPNFEKVPNAEIRKRVESDLIIQEAIYNDFKSHKFSTIPGYSSIKKFIPCVLEFLSEGIPVDLSKLSEVKGELYAEKSSLEQALKVIFGNISPRSSKQIDQAIYDKFKKRLPRTERGNPSFSAKYHSKIMEDIPETRIIVDLRKTETQLSFIEGKGSKNFVSSVLDGRIYPKFSFMSQRLLRSSYSNPPLNQMDKRLRGLVSAGDDEVMIGVDLVGLEWAVVSMAFKTLANDSTLWDELQRGEDIKEKTIRLFGPVWPSVHPSSRDLAKTINYAVSYGAGPTSICETLQLPPEEENIKRVLSCMTKRFPGLWKLKKVLEEGFEEEGFVRNMYRMKIHHEGHSLLNTYAQSTGAVYAYKALAITNTVLKEYSPSVRMILFNHDEGQFILKRPPFLSVNMLEDRINAELKKLPKFLTGVNVVVGDSWKESH